MINYYTSLTRSEILKLIDISKQSDGIELLAIDGKPLHEYLKEIMNQFTMPVIVKIVEIKKDKIFFSVCENEYCHPLIYENEVECSSDIFFACILYYLFANQENQKYIATKATLNTFAKISTQIHEHVKTVSGEPIGALIDLWTDSSDEWYLFLDEDQGKLKIFASSRLGADSILVDPDLFANFINYFNTVKKECDAMIRGDIQPPTMDQLIEQEKKVEKIHENAYVEAVKQSFQEKQKRLLRNHPTHRVWYKKIQLWGDLSIRYYYHFQDHPDLENTWVLKLHDNKLKGKSKFVKISREYADQLIKNYKKHEGQNPEIEHIVGMSITENEYDKFLLISDQHIRETD